VAGSRNSGRTQTGSGPAAAEAGGPGQQQRLSVSLFKLGEVAGNASASQAGVPTGHQVTANGCLRFWQGMGHSLMRLTALAQA
jgi:hypothetical protein